MLLWRMTIIVTTQCVVHNVVEVHAAYVEQPNLFCGILSNSRSKDKKRVIERCFDHKVQLEDLCGRMSYYVLVVLTSFCHCHEKC